MAPGSTDIRYKPRLGAAVALVAALSTALVAGAAGPAAAEGIELGLAHKSTGPWVADFLEGKPIEAGEARNFHLRVANTGTAKATFTIDDLGSPSEEYRPKYFRKQKNVTDALHGVGHELGVKAGKAKVIRARIKARANGGAPPACLLLRAVHDDNYIVAVSLNGLEGCQ